MWKHETSSCLLVLVLFVLRMYLYISTYIFIHIIYIIQHTLSIAILIASPSC